MAYPKNSIMDAGIQICVIASGGKDLPNDKSSNMKVYSPLEHSSQGVNLNHLAFSPMLHSPTAMSQCSNMGTLDPGTLVYVLKTSGQSGGLILGQANDIFNPGTTPGNIDLMNNDIMSELFTRTRNVNTPPDIKSEKVNGVLVKKIQESGEQWSHSLLKGLPTHGALPEMSGFRLPDLKNIPTAKQKNTGMISNQMMEQLPGQVMSLGQMFKSMGKKGSGGGGNPGGNVSGAGTGPTYMEQVMASETLTSQMRDAINSLSFLIQGQEDTGGVQYVTGGVVHEETYLENARDLLSQATNLDDVMYVLQRLQWDDELFGREKLDKVETEIETAWGTALQQVDVNGDVVITYQNPTTNGAVTFSQTSIIISKTAQVTDYKKIEETIDTTTWVGTLANVETTAALANGDYIMASDMDGSIGNDTETAQGAFHTVERVIDEHTIIFRASSGSVPIVGNVANVSIYATIVGEPVGRPAQQVFYNNMNNPTISPAFGSLPSGGGGGDGMGMAMGMMQQAMGMMGMFGRSAGTMQDMFGRLAPQGEQEAKKMHEKVNQSGKAQKMADVAKKTIDGGDPTNEENYKKTGFGVTYAE